MQWWVQVKLITVILSPGVNRKFIPKCIIINIHVIYANRMTCIHINYRLVWRSEFRPWYSVFWAINGRISEKKTVLIKMVEHQTDGQKCFIYTYYYELIFYAISIETLVYRKNFISLTWYIYLNYLKKKTQLFFLILQIYVAHTWCINTYFQMYTHIIFHDF